ncbi:VKT3 inhibitor, partial [Paradoxornis webbianus]|nr:VKT3 inhibitor [Sinosuthora webbiana]
WYFHGPTNSCRPFLFGGCRGNSNRFPSRRECQRRCQSPAARCLQPMDEGSCQRHSLLWYFHGPTNSCRPFLFGGCRGNSNRFPSRRECQRRC